MKLDQSYKSAENAQISRAETINRLTRTLEDSQKQCQALLESSQYIATWQILCVLGIYINKIYFGMLLTCIFICSFIIGRHII